MSKKNQVFSCGGSGLGYAGTGYAGNGYANKCFVSQVKFGCRSCLPQGCGCKPCSN